MLRNGRPRQYLLNEEVDRLLDGVLSRTTREQMTKLPREQVLDEVTMLGLLNIKLVHVARAKPGPP